ncbi:MAG: hypothetical protein QOF69_3362 [Solirubrobacteraceae bacterium]|jgi:hypothetical protein|nr:hypothetical protein [Solirubrobacteraceae bacterium]
MAPKPASRSSEHDDERRAITASNLVDILVGTGAPRLANPLSGDGPVRRDFELRFWLMM